MNGLAVNASQMGPWTAIAAEQMGAGYQVVWKAANADLYTVWNTDLSGNYLSTPIGPVSGGNAQLKGLENSFHQDLNGDGVIGAATFDIAVNYTGDPTYQSYFTAAAQRWQQVITGDLPDVGNIDDLQITANVKFIDGPGGILGQATPNLFRSAPSFLPYTGTMTFDSSDLANMASNGTLFYVILHEMGHVLGIGTLWSTLHLTAGSGSQYIGQGALNAYHQLGAGGASLRAARNLRRVRHRGRPLVGSRIRQRADDRLYFGSTRSAQHPDDRRLAGLGLHRELCRGGSLRAARSFAGRVRKQLGAVECGRSRR